MYSGNVDSSDFNFQLTRARMAIPEYKKRLLETSRSEASHLGSLLAFPSETWGGTLGKERGGWRDRLSIAFG